jgi:hypothetical protein
MNKTKYTCPDCANTIEVYVSLVQPPLCHSDKHTTKVTVMKEKENVKQP